MTCLAALFMSSKARPSFGFSKLCSFENLAKVRKEGGKLLMVETPCHYLLYNSLVKSLSIYPHYHVCIGQYRVWQLEITDIAILRSCHATKGVVVGGRKGGN
jgi:hypothetical protein